MGVKSAIGSPLPVRGMTALILGCGVLANRLFVWLDHARYVIITKRLMAYAGPSSNGRTLVFGTSYVGSNPAGPAIYLRTKPPSGGFLLPCRMQRVRTDEVKSLKTCLWHVFRDLPAGACAKGESARRARESCWPSHIFENETTFGRFFVALQVHALISVRMRFILGGVCPIATISQSQKCCN